MSFPVGCTDLETVVSRLIRLSPTAEQKKIFKNWTDVSRWVFNWTVDFIRSCVGWTPTWMDIKKYATRFLPEWTKKVPFQIKGIAIKEACEAFAAFYSPNISGKIGEGDFARIYRLLLHLDRLYSRRAKANRRNKKSLTKAIRRMTAKIRNLTTELHWKTARFLCENFAVILMPTYETKQMVKKAGRKIRSKTVRSMLGFANYKFRQRLKWMAERLGVTVLDVSESYTSKTHPQTGEVRNIGSAKRIKLTDGSVADRDLAGAYNILIKFLTEYCTLGDTPVVCN
ncbi:MAG: transposase [Desulfobacterales bacterium]|nr:transposase [Desulfobacterales bacterium]